MIVTRTFAITSRQNAETASNQVPRVKCCQSTVIMVEGARIRNKHINRAWNFVLVLFERKYKNISLLP